MQIQLSTDHTIESYEAMATRFSAAVETILNRFADHITHVDIRLSDENGGKTGPDDKRCMIEVHLAGRPPLVVTCHATGLDQAVDDAAHKMSGVIEGMLDRLHDPRGHGVARMRTEPS